LSSSLSFLLFPPFAGGEGRDKADSQFEGSEFQVGDFFGECEGEDGEREGAEVFLVLFVCFFCLFLYLLSLVLFLLLFFFLFFFLSVFVISLLLFFFFSFFFFFFFSLFFLSSSLSFLLFPHLPEEKKGIKQMVNLRDQNFRLETSLANAREKMEREREQRYC